MIYILYNPLSNNRKGKKSLNKLTAKFSNEQITVLDITATNTEDLLDKTSSDDTIIVTGGDGTLNHFVNSYGDREIIQKVYFYPSGSGNDFIRDLKEPLENDMVYLNPYMKNLPVITVNGKSYRFVNGVGYGVDGYACEERERLREKYRLKFSYSLIALKGILFTYKPTHASVTVDGETFEYKNVWLVPTMQGRYFGGGVMITPMQDRLNKEHTVTVGIAHCKSPFKLLFIFPSIYKGKHVKYTNVVEFHRGKDITVTFDNPTALQMDGEIIKNVLTYTVHSV